MALVKSNIPYAVKIDNFPEQANTLTYDGNNQSPTWNFFDADKMYISGGTTSEINAGTYRTEFLPFRKYVFPNGTKKTYFAEWTIAKAENFVTLSEYAGEVKLKFTRQFTISRLGDGEISVTSSDESIATVSLSGNVVTITGVNVDDVTITVNVAEGTNYLATSTVYACQSRKTQIQIPTVSGTSRTFDGSWQSPTITNAPNSSLVTRTGTFSAYGYSDSPYSFTYSIIDTDAYEWSNGSISPLTYSWRINKRVFALPAQVGTLTYNGNSQAPTWNFGNTNLIAITNGSATNAGTYTATFRLVDTVNCQWADGSTTDKTATFTIAKAKVAVPSQSGSLTFNGNTQTPSWNNYNASIISISGTTSAASAGTYTTTFTLNDSKNYSWADGTTTAAHTVTWTINQAAFTLTANDVYMPQYNYADPDSNWTSGVKTRTGYLVESAGGLLHLAVPQGWNAYLGVNPSNRADIIINNTTNPTRIRMSQSSSTPSSIPTNYQVWTVDIIMADDTGGKTAVIDLELGDQFGDYATGKITIIRTTVKDI